MLRAVMMSPQVHDTSLQIWRLQAHSSEKNASKIEAEKYLRAGSAATSGARMASQSAWVEEEDAGRGKRLCMGLSSPTSSSSKGEPRPALPSTPAGSIYSYSSPCYEPSTDNSVPNAFPDFPSQARSSRVGVHAWATAPADGFDSSVALGGPDLFQFQQSAPWPSQDKTTHSGVVQDAVQPPRFGADISPDFGAPTSAADQLRTPWQSALPAEELGGQYHISGVGAMDSSINYGDSASQDEIDGVIVSEDYSEAAGSVVQTPEDRVCLGMINTSSLRVSSAALACIPEGQFDVVLKVSGPVTTVHSSNNGDYIGLLDSKTAKSLHAVSREYDIRTRNYISRPPNPSSKKVEVPWGSTLPLYINIYGHAEHLDALGEALAARDIFLQHPLDKQDLASYKNPQYLVRPGEDFLTIKWGEAAFMRSNDEASEDSSSPDENQLDSIFKTAQGPEDCSGVEQSPRLTTSLQRHQRIALAMMLEKESGTLEGNDFEVLWSQKNNHSGRWFRNKITDTVQENPTLCLGGLLADEMGLGKTLTTIALISSTLDAMATTAVDEPPAGPSTSVEEYNKITLIITPKSTLHSWKEQFAKHTVTASIRVFFYAGNKRKSMAPSLMSHDVVITTYGTLTAEKNRKVKHSCDEDQPLLSHSWYRIVLDEAHVIRNASTKQCATACALKARHRWCLTGTPIQNRIEDFGALLQFLQVDPFNNPSFFMHEIAERIKCGHETGMKRLRQLVSAVCLRRTKACLGLPPRRNETQHVHLNDEEVNLYEGCKRSTIEFIDFVLKEDEKLKSSATAIQLILRLRQVCDHGKQMLSVTTLENIEDYMSSHGSREIASPSAEAAVCGICGCKVHDYISILRCMHPACHRCSQEMEIDVEPECSICSGTNLKKVDTAWEPAIRGQMDLDYQPSSKVTALLRNLESDKGGSTETPVKSVVFSYWTKMLDLISRALIAKGIRFERLDGKMSTPQRHRAIQTFRDEPGCTVFLATIGSAGVGIDLTAACRVHLIEPQWNPMAEEQALDRVHRIGQTRPVTAIRYIVKGSVEEYVVSLQKKKLDLIQQSLGAHNPPKAPTIKERLKDLHDFLTLPSAYAS